MIRQWGKTLIYRRNVPSLLRQFAHENRVVVLCYHRFESTPGQDVIPGMSVTPEIFRAQLALLQSVGQIVSYDEALKPAEGLRFVLTFDDGYRDNLSVLLPILKEMSIPALVFCTSDFVLGRMAVLPHDQGNTESLYPPLSPEELKILAADPLISIGAHTKTHARMDHPESANWHEQLVVAKRELEAVTGTPVLHFAYTYGPRDCFDWNQGPAALKRAGYHTFCSNYGGSNVPVDVEEYPLHIRRVPAIADANRWRFLGWLLT